MPIDQIGPNDSNEKKERSQDAIKLRDLSLEPSPKLYEEKSIFMSRKKSRRRTKLDVSFNKEDRLFIVAVGNHDLIDSLGIDHNSMRR
jgi:hypothetical protein